MTQQQPRSAYRWRVRLLLASALVVVFFVGLVVWNGSAPHHNPAPNAQPRASGFAPATLTPSPTPTPTPAKKPPSRMDRLKPVVSEAGFTHPGVFVNLDQLRTTRTHVLAKREPWLSNYRALASSPYLERTAPTFAEYAPAGSAQPLTDRCDTTRDSGCVTYCGSFNNPDVGCSVQQSDARAVYGLALRYWYTQKPVYAHRAIAILNAYSEHFAGNTGSQDPLMSAWMAEKMIRGAELIRYLYVPGKGEVVFDVEAFSQMLRAVVIPSLNRFDYGRNNGNWGLSAADGLINAAVFLDDRELYNAALARWRSIVPAYIYLSSDGAIPAYPLTADNRFSTPATLACHWLSNKAPECKNRPKTQPPLAYANGQSQETCRDLGHTAMGLAAMANLAETAWIQGDDLYGEQQERILAGTLYAVQLSQNLASQGWPDKFCAGVTDLSTSVAMPELAADVVFNAYVVRKNIDLTPIAIAGYTAPKTKTDPLAQFIKQHRSRRSPVHNVSAWEGLTHHLADKRKPK